MRTSGNTLKKLEPRLLDFDISVSVLYGSMFTYIRVIPFRTTV